MNKIRVNDLKYRYPHSEKLALNDISFEIKQGEFIGIVGKNSSGKSTLCYALTGLVPHFFKGAYGGQVFIDDLEVMNTEISDLSLKVGLVFENPFSQITGSKFTVIDEIAFGLENMGIEREEMSTRIEASLKLLDIEHIKEKNPFSLSGGQMQRVAIASVLAMRPDILILDEPTSQLDPQGSDEVFKVVESLTKEGMTVIMAEHKMEKLAQYSDKILLLHEGKLIDFDTPKKIFSKKDILDYGVSPPIFTKISRALNIFNKEDSLLPVTLNEILTIGHIHSERGEKK
ncbi:ATP-binding cassette domain-containing protein [Heyndrickxia oleronia]|uniref:energy-coupling factor ABC transporter ATP-binding protein n=1 Tax=Heyndrickxia oleronia TaxID=38875 RepID=UPI00203BEEFD|nr:ATP-binding cassette domain-containing protein [Heyndrickxia oleronia]MCM3452542.1 ATP-binding cassette domain-containing protein [Heyndrickxia oleronia]